MVCVCMWNFRRLKSLFIRKCISWNIIQTSYVYCMAGYKMLTTPPITNQQQQNNQQKTSIARKAILTLNGKELDCVTRVW